MKHFFSFLFTSLAVLFHVASAQSFSTRVSSNAIGKKDMLQVEYIAENLELQDLVLPVFSGWSIVSGPNFSSNRLQTGNIVKQQIIYTIILQPQATGRLNIPGAKATIEGRARLSNSIVVEVKNTDHVAGTAPSPIPPVLDRLPFDDDDINDDQVLKKGETVRDKIKNNLLVQLVVSKKSVVVGEPILATYKLCTRIRSQSRVVKQPAFSGCTVIELTSANDPVPQKEKIGDKWYNVYIIRQVQLIPLQAGNMELPEVSIENTITFYRDGQFSYRDLFYNNPSVKPEEATVTFSNKPLLIEVKNLPQPAPDGFNGAVGDFTLSVENTGSGSNPNNGNELAISVRGQGNLQQTKPPVIAWPKGMEGFEPLEKENIDKSSFPFKVTKTISYPFVVSKTGDYTIPPVRFTYFDAADETYKSLVSAPLKVHIKKSSKTILPQAIKNYTNDFYFRLYLILGAGLLALLTGLIFYNRKHRAPATTAKPAEKPIIQPAEAKVDTESYIYEIRELEPGTNGPLFYKQLSKHITSWLAAKFHLKPDDIDAFCDQNGDLANALQKISSVLHSCSVGMYTPMYNIEEAVQHRLTALEAINSLEKL